MKWPLEVMPALTRVFTNGKKLIVQDIGGKTYRQLFDKEGRQLVDQVKSIERFNVGNKKVINITKNTAYSDSRYDYLCGYETTDKVYSNAGKLLGTRWHWADTQRMLINGKEKTWSMQDLLLSQEAQFKSGNYIKGLTASNSDINHGGLFQAGKRIAHD